MEKISDLNGKREQNVAIKFCVRLGKSPTETAEMIRAAYQEAALPQNKIFEWHKKFSGLTVADDRVKIEGGPDGDPEEAATSLNGNNHQQLVCEESHQARSIKAMIKKDRRVTEEQVAEAMQLELARVHVIIHEILGYKKIGERWKKKKIKFRNE